MLPSRLILSSTGSPKGPHLILLGAVLGACILGMECKGSVLGGGSVLRAHSTVFLARPFFKRQVKGLYRSYTRTKTTVFRIFNKVLDKYLTSLVRICSTFLNKNPAPLQ